MLFNAAGIEWGMPHPGSRGKRILQMARTGPVVLNIGFLPKYRQSGSEGSISDVILLWNHLPRYLSECLEIR